MTLLGREKFKMEIIFKRDEERREMVRNLIVFKWKTMILYWSILEVKRGDCEKRYERIILQCWKTGGSNSREHRSRGQESWIGRFLELKQEN